MLVNQLFNSTGTENSQEVYNFFHTYCLDMFDSVTLIDNAITLTKGTATIAFNNAVSANTTITLESGQVKSFTDSNYRKLTQVVRFDNGVLIKSTESKLDNTFIIKTNNNTLMIMHFDSGSSASTKYIADMQNSTNFNSLSLSAIQATKTSFAPVLIPESDNIPIDFYFNPFYQYDIVGTMSTGSLNFVTATKFCAKYS